MTIKVETLSIRSRLSAHSTAAGGGVGEGLLSLWGWAYLREPMVSNWLFFLIQEHGQKLTKSAMGSGHSGS